MKSTNINCPLEKLRKLLIILGSLSLTGRGYMNHAPAA